MSKRQDSGRKSSTGNREVNFFSSFLVLLFILPVLLSHGLLRTDCGFRIKSEIKCEQEILDNCIFFKAIASVICYAVCIQALLVITSKIGVCFYSCLLQFTID